MKDHVLFILYLSMMASWVTGVATALMLDKFLLAAISTLCPPIGILRGALILTGLYHG